MKKINVVRTFSFMFAAVMLTKVLGLLRNIIFASLYGSSPEAIAFLTAQRLPLVLFDISLGAAVSSAFIPIFTKCIEQEGSKKAMRLTNSFTNLVILISSILTIFGIIFSPFLVRLLAMGLEGETFNLAVKYIRILFPMIIFTAITFVFVGVLQSLNQFKIPAVVSLVSSAILIIYLSIFNKSFGMNGYIIIMLIAWSSQVIIQLPSMVKSGYRFLPEINFSDGKIKQIGLLMIPILFSSWEQPINSIINMSLASFIDGGKAVPALEYANGFYLIVAGGFTMAMANLIFPSLSRTSILEDKTQFKNTIRKALKATIYFIFPLMIGFIILAYDIITMVYQRGNFTNADTYRTGTALLFYCVGMIGFGIQEICKKAYYSSNKAGIPMKIAVVTITINIILSLILSRVMGIGGIALAASISATIGGITQLVILNKIHKGIITSNFMKDIFKIIIISVIMGVVIYILKIFIGNINIASVAISKIVVIGSCGGIGMLIYFIITAIFKVEEAVIGLSMIKTKLKFR